MAAATKVKLYRKTVVSLMEFLGWKSAENWDNDRLAERLQKINDVYDEDDLGKPEDEKVANALVDVLAGIEDGSEFEVVDGEEAKAKDGSDDETAEKTEKDEGDFFDEAEKKEDEKPKKEKKEKRPGVIATIAEVLEGASEEKPVTKDDILKVLVKKFPDREADSMKKTINVQVPTQLRNKKDINVQKNEKGYYVA